MDPATSAAPGGPSGQAPGPDDREAARRHRRLTRAVVDQLRDTSVQLTLLNQHVSGHAELRPVDLECLDLISRLGPISPSELAHRAGLHRATMTGVLDRLERGGWIARERSAADRRAVQVRADRSRNAEIMHLYSGMNGAMEQILAGYSDAELELLAGFLRRTAEAGREAAEQLAR